MFKKTLSWQCSQEFEGNQEDRAAGRCRSIMNKALLKSAFGHDEFHHGQEELIDALQNGRDLLGVMATGSGKSLCYQFPAVERNQRCLVVSPLDQLDERPGQETRARRHSGRGSAWPCARCRDRRLAMEGWAVHRLRFLYVAPERFADERFMAALANDRPDYVAIDEAHLHLAMGT